MRIPAVGGRAWLVVILLIISAVISVKYSIDQSYIQVSQLNTQLRILKTRYNMSFINLATLHIAFKRGAKEGKLQPPWKNTNLWKKRILSFSPNQIQRRPFLNYENIGNLMTPIPIFFSKYLLTLLVCFFASLYQKESIRTQKTVNILNCRLFSSVPLEFFNDSIFILV